MLKTRVLTETDLPAVLRLKEQAGWNQLPADLQRFLYLQPDGCFLGEFDGAPVGTACGFLFGRVAWIAMVLVDEAFRGRGIGRELMERVLDLVECEGAQSIRLDATALGRPLYESLGFVTQFKLTRYHANLSTFQEVASPLPADSGVTQPLPPDRLDEVVEFDLVATSTDRGKLIRRLYAEAPDSFRIVDHDGALQGFFTTRPGSRARHLGPCLAKGDAGAQLLDDGIRRHAGGDVFIDVPVDHLSVNAWLSARGFQPQRELLRMCRGTPVIEDLNRLWASSGPEKG